MVLVSVRQRLHILQAPQPEPAPKRHLVMAQPGARRQLLQLAGIPTAQYDVIRQERDPAHEVSTQGSETARQVARTASASDEQGRESLEQAGHSLEETIRERPL